MTSISAKLFFGILAAFAVAAGASAQFSEGAWRVESLYASSYVFRGVERADASTQATVDYSNGNFRATGWANQPFNVDGDDAREVSLSAAYSYKLSEAVSLEGVASHAWFGSVPSHDVKRSFELGLNATLTSVSLAGFTPTLGYHRDFRFESDTVQLSFFRSMPLTKLGTFIEMNVFAGWTAGKNWRPDGLGPKLVDGLGYWGGDVTVPYQIGRYGLIVGFHYADTRGRSTLAGPFGRDFDVNFWATVGVSIEF